MNKSEQLAECEGYDDVNAMIEDNILRNIVPGICQNDDCDYTTNCEPDATENWCESCETKTVESCLSMEGY